MARYLDVHSGLVGATRQQLEYAHQRRLSVADAEGVTFERAWLDPECGKAFCLSTAPTKEAVMRVHDQAGQSTAEVYEVPIEIGADGGIPSSRATSGETPSRR